MKHQQLRETAQRHETNRQLNSAWRMALGLSFLSSMILLAVPARAGLLYWDALQAKSGTGGGGTGNWNTTSLHWYPGSGSSDLAWNNSGFVNTAAFAGTAGTVTLTAAISANKLVFASGGYTVVSNKLTLNGTAPAIDVKSGTNAISSILAGSAGLIVSGTGNLILSGTNIYTKATTVNGGTLTLDFSQSVRTTNILDATLATAYINMNGCTLVLRGKSGAVNSQTFIGANGLALRAASTVTLVQNGASSLSLNVLGIARNVGATVDCTLPATGGIATTLGSANTLLTVNSVPFATVGGEDWAAKDAANAKLIAGSGISGFYTPSTATTLSGNADVASGVNTTLAVAPSTTSLRFNQAEARTITMNSGITLTPLGILITPNVGNNLTTITGGRLRGGSGNDLVIIQNNTANSLLINSQIINSGAATALTKSGPGLATLTATSTYTGLNYLNDGTLSISGNANLGDPATGAAIHLAGGALLATETLALDNSGANARSVSLLGKGGTFAVRTGKTLTVRGTISDHVNGAGPLTVGTAGETGTLLLAGTNTYTSPTTVNAGTLAVNGSVSNAITVASGATLTGTGRISAAAATAAVTINGGFLDPGTAGGVGSLSVTGNVAFASGGTLQVQVNAGSADRLTVSGNVTAATGLVNVEVTATGAGAGPWKIISASAIMPTFTTSNPKMIVKKRAGGTELWLERNAGTILVIR